ncbi:MAG: gene transfer agent family protein [Emcibacter sp.]|nr:gene transfer agent family protein [Emcibacter sp.]
MSVRSFRSSVIITLSGAEYRLKPTFQAIMDMEDRLGGIIGLAVKAADGDFGLKDMTVIIWATMEDRMNFEQVGELILTEGLAKVSPVVRDLLTLCLVGISSSNNDEDHDTD